MTRVLISYSHDSVEHKAAVLRLADRLRLDGVECELDQYINGSPPEGWIRWMENRIEWAEFVLLVCTPTYLRRYRGQALDSGRGVTLEGVVISQTLYDDCGRNTKFIAVLPESGSVEDIPRPLKAFTAYRMMAEYEALYRVLTGQPATPPPDVGHRRALGNEPRNLVSVTTGSTNHPNIPTMIKKLLRDQSWVAWLGVAVLAGIVLATLVIWASSLSSIKIEQSPCAVGNTGTVSGSITQTCVGDQP